MQTNCSSIAVEVEHRGPVGTQGGERRIARDEGPRSGLLAGLKLLTVPNIYFFNHLNLIEIFLQRQCDMKEMLFSFVPGFSYNPVIP